MGCNVSKNSQVDNAPERPSSSASNFNSIGTSSRESADSNSEAKLIKPSGPAKGVKRQTSLVSHAPITPYNQQSYSQVIYDEQPQIPIGPQIKLIYFDYDGSAEVTRLILIAGAMAFEDFRFHPSYWPTIEPKLPIGAVPIMVTTSSSAPLVQSVAIARYAAKITNLAGRTSLEMAIIDAVVDTALELFIEFVAKIVPYQLAPSNGNIEKLKSFRGFVRKDVPVTLKKLDKLIRLYGANGYFVGNQLSWADLYVYQVIGPILAIVDSAVLVKYPKLVSNRNRIETDSRLLNYLRTRKRYY